MIKTVIICTYIAHKIWWKRKQKMRTVSKGSKDWNRIIKSGEVD